MGAEAGKGLAVWLIKADENQQRCLHWATGSAHASPPLALRGHAPAHRAERDAATARLSAVVPQLEALEATWARLHGICGAATADDVIAYWQGELATAAAAPGCCCTEQVGGWAPW